MNKNEPQSEHGANTDIRALTDRSLMRRFKSGDDDAATMLYSRYANRLLKLTDREVYDDMVLQADPEGIVQSVFRTFFRRVSDGQYDAVVGDDLWKLMLVIALNKIRKTGTYHRAAKRSVNRTKNLINREHGEQLGQVPDDFALTNLRLTIEDLLGELPEDQQKMITARIEGHEIAEISRMVERSKRSVERILQNFRLKLQQICEAEK